MLWSVAEMHKGDERGYNENWKLWVSRQWKQSEKPFWFCLISDCIHDQGGEAHPYFPCVLYFYGPLLNSRAYLGSNFCPLSEVISETAVWICEEAVCHLGPRKGFANLWGQEAFRQGLEERQANNLRPHLLLLFSIYLWWGYVDKIKYWEVTGIAWLSSG